MNRTSMIGRGAQFQALIDAMGEARRGRARTIVVSGEAGIGKTTLIDAAVAESRAGLHTVRIAGHPAESDLPLAGVHHLVREAHLADVVTATGDDPLHEASALLEALTTLARTEPLLMIIDDAQWLDQASRRALVFVARRLDADAVCVVFGIRTPDDSALAVGTRIDVEPLTRDESMDVLDASFPHMSARVAARIAQQSGGLPLALREIPMELTPAQQQGTEPLPGDLPPGRSMTALFAKRLAALSHSARLALLVASFEPLAPREYREVLGALGCSLDDLDGAESMGLARLRDGRCEFRHPMVSAAVRAEAASRDLSAVHRALAAASGDDAVRRATHVKQDPYGDPATRRAAIRQGAVAAFQAGRYDEAADLWKTAAELADSPSEVRAHLREAVRCLVRSGAGPEARWLIEHLLPETTDDTERADLLRDLTSVSLWTRSVAPDDEESIEEFAITLLTSGDERGKGAAVDLLSVLATATLGAGEFRRARHVCAAMVTHAAERLSIEQRMLCAATAVMVGEASGGTGLRGDWTDAYPWHRVLDPATPTGFITVILGWLGEFRVLDDVIDHCRQAIDDHGPSAAGVYIAGSMTAGQERYRGRWDRALLEYEALERIVIDTDFAAPYPFIALRHAYLLAARGDRTGCEQMRRHARERAPVWAPVLAHLDHAVAGLLALAQRDFSTALVHLDQAGKIERDVGLVPSGYLSRLADGLEAAWRLGEAESRVGELEQFEDAMRAMHHHPMMGLAARCRALIAAPGDMDALFAQAISLLEQEPDGFEVARTHLLWGERLRRVRRKADAHEKLSLAHEVFTRLGATSWAEQCRSELAACGVRRVQVPAQADGLASRLTPREFEVAREVATGVTNAAAARRLYISERTVEFHLSSVFRKLDISGREALAEALGT